MPEQWPVGELPTGIAGAGLKRRRVLRGGSFNNNPQNVRCAYRNHNDPDNRNNNNGFRVVVSTFFASGNAWRGFAPFWAEENGGVRSWPRPPLSRGRANSSHPAPWETWGGISLRSYRSGCLRGLVATLANRFLMAKPRC
jgi:hypothetical protein